MSFSHLDAAGHAAMVDVGAKPVTERVAVASGRIRMAAETLARIQSGDTPKGDLLAVARIAGIQAAKHTADLIPLCHSLPLDQAAIAITPEPETPGLRVTATVRTRARTGVEMEALTGAAVALLTIYDMAKAIDRAMVIEQVMLVEKQGGRRGDWRHPEAP